VRAPCEDLFLKNNWRGLVRTIVFAGEAPAIVSIAHEEGLLLMHFTACAAATLFHQPTIGADLLTRGGDEGIE
jgi:hypothetical protein